MNWPTLNALFLAAAAINPGAPSLAEPVAVNLFLPTEVRIRVELHDPILHFRYSELPAGVPRPSWYEAYQRVQRLDRFSYDDWIGYFTPEYIRRFNLNPTSFAQEKLAYNKDRSSSGLSSALWTVHVEIGNRRFCWVVFDPRAHVDVTPLSSAGTSSGLTSLPFEMVDGRWKNQVFNDMGAALNVPFTNRTEMAELLRLKNGIKDRPNSITVTPIEMPLKK